jgi:hypothetical protein
MQGKRSTFEVGELAEEVGGGALGGVLSIHGGDVCELGRTGIGSRFRRAICPAGSGPGRSIESGGSSMSCLHVVLAAFVKIDWRHPHGWNCPLSDRKTRLIRRNPLIIRRKILGIFFRPRVDSFHLFL